MKHTPSFQTSLIRALIYGAFIAIALFGLFYLYQYYHATTLVLTESTAPNLIATNVDAWRFDVKGNPQYRLLSATAKYYQKDNHTDFTKVIGYLYMPKQPFWMIKADTALACHGYETVYLKGNVYIHQEAGKTNLPQTLTTDHLTVYPQKKIAQTDALVRATRQDMLTTSQGALFNLNNNSIKLHQVYTVYIPKSST